MPAGIAKKDTETITRLFGDLPVVEAKSRLLVIAKSRDATGATRQDPANCFFAKACQRLFDSTAVVFFRTVAYVDLPNNRGWRRLMRFALPVETRVSIARFDATGEIAPGGYELLPPMPAQTLERKAKRAKELARKAVIKGVRRARRPKKIMAVASVGEIRNGAGMVHFTKTESKT